MQLIEGQMCVYLKKKKWQIRSNKIRLESARVKGSNKVFSRFLKMGKVSAAWIELGRSFHQMGTVNEKVSERDFVPLWDGSVMRRSLTECELLEGI